MRSRPRATAGGTTLRGTVLLVDDEPEILSSLREFLARRFPRVEVHCAPDGPHALDILRTLDPDVILSDHVMPGMDGIAFLAEARARRPDAFRILQTGFADTPLAIRAINEAHVQAFVEKPMESEEIASAIRKGIRTSTRLRAEPLRGVPDKGTVLVVDDDTEICALITRYFERYLPGIHVASALSAQGGLTALAESPVDVILSDYRLPDMTGMEFLTEAHRAYPHTRSILLTGDPAHGLAHDASDDPAVDRFFIKPVNMAAFSRAIQMLLPRH
jgi:DNA-binding NtrC family response regulator